MYDKLITIYQPTTTTNAYNEKESTLVPYIELRASVNYKGGREGFYARQVVATGDVVFKIRYYSGITEKMSIAYNGRMYNINHIAEVGRRQQLELTAQMSDNIQVPV